ncbi:hypothetical protein [Streptomyces sp. NPDC056525]|uniref:hypothetical protein n=1 Tax=unclassified Streptomyces TaxID=2593676 RepID=UPI001E31305F|nr:hypothetical protein [Streptomyces sp. CB02980]
MVLVPDGGRMPTFGRVRGVLGGFTGLTPVLGALPHPHLRAARRRQVRQVPYFVLAPHPGRRVHHGKDAQDLA